MRMSHRWVRVTARLLRIIILACCEDSVAGALVEVQTQFITMLSRFRATNVQTGLTYIKENLPCDPSERYLPLSAERPGEQGPEFTRESEELWRMCDYLEHFLRASPEDYLLTVQSGELGMEEMLEFSFLSLKRFGVA